MDQWEQIATLCLFDILSDHFEFPVPFLHRLERVYVTLGDKKFELYIMYFCKFLLGLLKHPELMNLYHVKLMSSTSKWFIFGSLADEVLQSFYQEEARLYIMEGKLHFRPV